MPPRVAFDLTIPSVCAVSFFPSPIPFLQSQVPSCALPRPLAMHSLPSILLSDFPQPSTAENKVATHVLDVGNLARHFGGCFCRKGRGIRFREELTSLLYLPVNNSGVREKFPKRRARTIRGCGWDKGTYYMWLVHFGMVWRSGET